MPTSDAATTTRARTARIPHLCDNCHWSPSLRGQPTIAPGHRYLIHTAFPNSETNQSNRPYTLKECGLRDRAVPRRPAGCRGLFDVLLR